MHYAMPPTSVMNKQCYRKCNRNCLLWCYLFLHNQFCIFTSWRKSAKPFLSGHLNPHDSKKLIMQLLDPWYTVFPSAIKIISSKSSYVSGAGWRSETSMVDSEIWANCWRQETIWKVVELSSPVDISSMKSAFEGPTIISPDSLTIFLKENS